MFVYIHHIQYNIDICEHHFNLTFKVIPKSTTLFMTVCLTLGNVTDRYSCNDLVLSS